jgi:hypothetical protein
MGTLGGYQNARRHGITRNRLSVELHGADFPHTLTARHWVSFWTGGCGDFAEALRCAVSCCQIRSEHWAPIIPLS